MSAQYSGDIRYAASTSSALQQNVVLAPDFTIAPASTSLSMSAGSVATMDVHLVPINGTLNQDVAIAYDGLPAGATVTSNAPTPLLIASNSVTLTLSFKTPASAVVKRSGLFGLPLLLASLLRIRRRSVRPLATGAASLLALAFVSVACLVAFNGCGGGYLSGASTSAQSVSHSYPVSVIATTMGVTGSPITHTASFTLVVTP